MGKLNLAQDPLRSAFGLNLRRAREERGFENVMELAHLAGVSHQTIRDIESGKRWPEMDTLLMLVASLDVDIETVLPPNWRRDFANYGLKLLQGKVQALGDQSKVRSFEGSRQRKSRKTGTFNRQSMPVASDLLKRVHALAS